MRAEARRTTGFLSTPPAFTPRLGFAGAAKILEAINAKSLTHFFMLTEQFRHFTMLDAISQHSQSHTGGTSTIGARHEMADSSCVDRTFPHDSAYALLITTSGFFLDISTLLPIDDDADFSRALKSAAADG